MLDATVSVPFAPGDGCVELPEVLATTTVSANHVVFGQWQYASCEPGAIVSPQALLTEVAASLVVATNMPGALPIASAMSRRCELDLDAPPDFDGRDWWIWCTVSAPDVVQSQLHALPNAVSRWWLNCEGLASYVDVWWNSQLIGRADNMFVPWAGLLPVPGVTAVTGDGSLLALHCRAMVPMLRPQRPRARWRARLLESQEWRWHRTTHLGRMPGVGPRVPPVGPWQPITVRAVAPVEARVIDISATRDAEVSSLRVRMQLHTQRHEGSDVFIESAMLWCGRESAPLQLVQHEQTIAAEGSLSSTTFAPWWPHTHGAPAVYPARVVLQTSAGEQYLDFGNVGFRSVQMESTDHTFGFSINNTPIFLRGTCWTPANWAQLDTITEQFEADIPLLVDAGINCIRFSGCFVYPTERMLALCDVHGLTVWHDMMFSVLDYPMANPDFLDRVTLETQHVVRTVRRHASVLVLCGNSEVEQQAAMMGIPASDLPHSLFRETIAAVVNETAPEMWYWPGTPNGGIVPTQLTRGTAHYFGVGAYRRDLHDARRSAVRFATECLAFANLPEPESPSAVYRNGILASERCHVHVPKDGGADWDFADIRSYYANALCGVATEQMDAYALTTYGAIHRVAVMHAMERTLQEFRRLDSPTRGAITWLWRDPWDGAGWGMVDHHGRPKSAWYACKRASRPVALALSDEGLDGVAAHLWNDSQDHIDGFLTVRLLNADGSVGRSVRQAVHVPAHSQRAIVCDDLLGGFADTAHAYAFRQSLDAIAPAGVEVGRLPNAHVAVHVAWTSPQATSECRHVTGRFLNEVLIDDATYFAADPNCDDGSNPVIATVQRIDESTIRLTLTSRAITRWVRPASINWWFDDAYFTLVPGITRVITGHQYAAIVPLPSQLVANPASDGAREALGTLKSDVVTVDAFNSIQGGSIPVPATAGG